MTPDRHPAEPDDVHTTPAESTDDTTDTTDSTDSTDTPPVNAPLTPTQRRALWGGGAVAAVVVLLVLVTVVFATEDEGDRDQPAGAEDSMEYEFPQRTSLERAKDRCAETASSIRTGDDGKSLIGNGVGVGAGLGEVADLRCIFRRLEVPDSVIAQLESTRALDGRQEASWDGYTASWSYHPDNGIDIVIEEAG